MTVTHTWEQQRHDTSRVLPSTYEGHHQTSLYWQVQFYTSDVQHVVMHR